MTSFATGNFNLFLQRGFLEPEVCKTVIEEMCVSAAAPASVYGAGSSGKIDERVRKATRLSPAADTCEHVRLKLWTARLEIARHFGLTLESCEGPQFLRYKPGDFFVAHQDGNTGLLQLDKEQGRKISVVIFLNRQSESAGSEPGTNIALPSYEGGSLVFTNWREGHDEFRMLGEAGTLVAFPAETTHEVTLVTAGERYSIVSWFG